MDVLKAEPELAPREMTRVRDRLQRGVATAGREQPRADRGDAFAHYDDLYFAGSRVRLRVMTERPSGRVLYKLTQKLQQPDARVRRVTTFYLTADEFRVFANLPGARVAKRRHRAQSGGVEWSVDAFEGALAGLVLAEREFDSEAELRAASPQRSRCSR